jgi:anti-sigma regulatory factor (Ser/Thr protein kinase)
MTGASRATIVLAAEAAEVSTARRFVRRELADGADACVLSDLQLIASELFTNAVEHGAHPEVEVIVEASDDTAEVTVRSGGPADVGPAVGWQVADAESITGRGLGIVRELADELIVERADDAFVVTARCRSRQCADA